MTRSTSKAIMTREQHSRVPPAIDFATTALFLDIDGTLLDIAATPDAVEVPPQLPALLLRLQTLLNGAIAIVTGRRIADADRLLAPVRLIASGVHGCELRVAPDHPVTFANPMDRDVLAAIMQIPNEIAGVLVEPKGSGIAIHYRLSADHRFKIEKRIREIIAGQSTELVVAGGRKVFEIVPRGFSKGSGLEALMELPEFAGRRPLVIGDDVGDVPAFDIALALGGTALKVSGEFFDRSAADFENPTAVRNWLDAVSSA